MATGSESDEDTRELLALRQLRGLLDDDPLVDQRAPSYTYRCLDADEVVIRQDPRLAVRADGDADATSADALGCDTEATSATGAVVWDSSITVARFLEILAADVASPFCVVGKSCFELGAGCGLISCVLRRLGAGAVVASERPEMLPLLTENLDTNRCDDADRVGPAAAIAHMWGDAIDTAALPASTYDLVLAVDCVYDECAVAPLLASFANLGVGAPGSTTTALVASDTSYRRPAALELFHESLAARNMRAVEVDTSFVSEEFTRGTITLWAVRGCVEAAKE